MASSVSAAALGGISVFAFTAGCEQIGYIAETSGQVAVGTGVFGLVRQLADLIADWSKQRSLREVLATSLQDYIAAAGERRRQQRDYEALAGRIRELRELQPPREREPFDLALSELRNHGTGGEFALLGEPIQTTAMRALKMRLA